MIEYNRSNTKAWMMDLTDAVNDIQDRLKQMDCRWVDDDLREWLRCLDDARIAQGESIKNIQERLKEIDSRYLEHKLCGRESTAPMRSHEKIQESILGRITATEALKRENEKDVDEIKDRRPTDKEIENNRVHIQTQVMPMEPESIMIIWDPGAKQVYTEFESFVGCKQVGVYAYNNCESNDRETMLGSALRMTQSLGYKRLVSVLTPKFHYHQDGDGYTCVKATW